jgi:hypothetical protein
MMFSKFEIFLDQVFKFLAESNYFPNSFFLWHFVNWFYINNIV